MAQFDRFTERARNVLAYAREEAQLLNHRHIGTEHLLLGLVREEQGIAGRVLNEHGVTLDKLRTGIEFVIGHSEAAVEEALTLSPRAKVVLELAISESIQLKHGYVGTEHLLLGIVREGKGVGIGVLESSGIRLDALSQSVLDALGTTVLPDPPESPWMPRSLDRYTERARKVLHLAQEEAERFNHNYIGTEHLLLGLVREGDSVGARVLRSMGVQLPKVRSAVEFIIGRGEGVVVGEIGLTPRSKKVLELALDESHRLNHKYVGTEHLLLGMVREGEGIAAGVLEGLGVNLEKVRVQVMRALSGEEIGPPPPPPFRSIGYGPGVESLSRRTLALLLRAFDEAEKTGHPRVGIGHLLLSMLQETDTVVAHALAELQPDLDAVRQAVVEVSPPPEGEYEPAQLLSRRARHALQRAKYEATIRSSPTVEPAHVLLGIAHDAQLVAEELESKLGIDIDDLRRRIEAALAEQPPEPPVTDAGY